MKTIQKTIVFFLLMFPLFGLAETKEIPFTLDDRDRLIRTEQEVQSLKKEMDVRFESVEKQMEGMRLEMNARFETIDQRFEQLFSFLWAFIGIFTTMMASVFGFAFWDRKLSLDPIKKENAKTVGVLRDYSDHQPKLREIMKGAGLL
jgi:hypothetical protein